MKRLWFICFLLVFSGCFSRSAMMTRNTFDDIQIGSTLAEVQPQIGNPYKITRKGPELFEYEYIEKINLNYGYIVENHYFLLVNNGSIIGKWVSQEKTKDYNLMYQADPNYPAYYYPGY